MNTNLTVKLIDAINYQNKASNPNISTWVTANAGSGKTFVLVKRIIRILLSNVDPDKIICLTFTKIAAAEMKKRLFKILFNWTILSNELLIIEIKQIASIELIPEELLIARNLFAKVLDVPGGLKIQTIHSFCEKILRTFPIDSNISPKFKIIDDKLSNKLLDDSKNIILTEIKDDSNFLYKNILIISKYINENKFDELLNELIKNRKKIFKLINSNFIDILQNNNLLDLVINNLGDALELNDLLKKFNYIKIEDLYLSTLADKSQWPLDYLKKISKILKEDKQKNNLKFAYYIDKALDAKNVEIAVESYFNIFLTKNKKPIKSLFSKKIQINYIEIYKKLINFQIDAVKKYEKLLSIKLYTATVALFTIFNKILCKFIQQKQNQNLLDYDDLISLTINLLNKKTLLFNKLDSNIKHILIDEAQDINSEQWKIIELLINKIIIDKKVTNLKNTLFVVGDEKQSIYKFQGADKKDFKKKEIFFKQNFKNIRMKCESISFDLSFRSSCCILKAVDRVFNFTEASLGVCDNNIKNNIKHFANKNSGGIVELWPLEINIKNSFINKTDDLAYNKFDHTNSSASTSLAKKIAAKIARWIINGRKLKSKNRKIKPSDILILVRRRNSFLISLIKEIKKYKIPISNIDSINLYNELIIKDMVALGKFCLLPENEFILSIILKSPLIGINDKELFKLLYKRKNNLWQILKEQKRLKWKKIFILLNDWRILSNTLSPFDFYMQVLSTNNIRKKLITRLGFYISELLDEFLDLIESYELNYDQDLNSLLIWIEKNQNKFKKEVNQQKNEIRIMTIHGAKGLESNIVILPDTYSLPQKTYGKNLMFNFNSNKIKQTNKIKNINFVCWQPNKSIEPKLINKIKKNNYIEEIKEYHRLLYVAMTRAKDELYIVGYTERNIVKKVDFNNWYQLIEKAFTGWAKKITNDDNEVIFRYEIKNVIKYKKTLCTNDFTFKKKPNWLTKKIYNSKIIKNIESPSKLLNLNIKNNNKFINNFNKHILPTIDSIDKRYLRGNLIHKLLEILPKINKNLHKSTIELYLNKYNIFFKQSILNEINNEVLNIINNKDFSIIFSSKSQSEVPIIGKIKYGIKSKLISGKIDRLIITNKKILILDYKSNYLSSIKIEEINIQYLAQMASYRELLKQIYPNYSIISALLWTYNGQLTILNDNQLDQAYINIFTKK